MRVDLTSDGHVYVDHVATAAEKVDIRMSTEDDYYVETMDGSRERIAGRSHYDVRINDHQIVDPQVFFWKDVEAYLASEQQYQIHEMELP